jgi:SsrA-binding protein
VKKTSAEIATNRAARFHYEILEEFEAGMILTGIQAKSLQTVKPKIAGSFVGINHHDEAWLRGLEIPIYKYAKGQEHDPKQPIKLLLKEKEITTIKKALHEKGVTVVLINLHLKNHKIKVRIGLARGKKKWDKREALKKRDVERDVRREMKR